VNNCIGAGFLAVPWVFLYIGYPTAFIIVAVFFVVSTTSSMQLIES
jgi:hypothetical protein